LAKLYSEAAVFVYPSLYEGFGLPVLEAMAAGTPVVTSNRSSLPEAAGIAAVLINPDNPKSIAEGLESVLMGKISRSQMVKAGREQVKKFSWQKSAGEIIKVLENIK
jgi:glycosyltransferase involved in cell wall biosynthesis